MKLAYVLLQNGEKKVTFVKDNKFFTVDNEGLDCVFQDPIRVISALKGLREDLELVEVRPLRFLPSVIPRKVFLPAVNFKSHSQESSSPPPPEPYFFTKFGNAVIGHEDTITIPYNVKRADYEGEIGIVMGKRGKYIPKEKAMDYVFGFTVINDISFRDYQFPERHPYGLNWVMGKALDTALPIGPWIVTKDEVKFPLRIRTRLNGNVVQDGSTEDMVFSIEELISYISNGITLEPGDVISTGTPAGVAEFGGKKYLEDGDIVEVEVSGVGILRNYIKKENLITK